MPLGYDDQDPALQRHLSRIDGASAEDLKRQIQAAMETLEICTPLGKPGCVAMIGITALAVQHIYQRLLEFDREGKLQFEER